MARLLDIRCSPRGDASFSNRMAEVFLARHRRADPAADVDCLDLFEEELPEFRAPEAAAKHAVMAGEQPGDDAGRAWRRVIEVIDRFKAAEKLLLSAPMWNFSIPYRLKQYLDIIVQPGLTFSYSPEAGYSGLVTGRPAALLLARGGDYASPQMTSFDRQRPYLELVLGFMGFEDIRTAIAQPTARGSPEEVEAMFRRVAAQVEALAEGF